MLDFNIYGTMKKNCKALKPGFLCKQVLDHVLDEHIVLIDMGFIWHLAIISVEYREKRDGIPTFGMIMQKGVSLVFSRHPNAHELLFVIDPYNKELNTKASQHQQHMTTPSDADGTKRVYIKE